MRGGGGDWDCTALKKNNKIDKDVVSDSGQDFDGECEFAQAYFYKIWVTKENF